MPTAIKMLLAKRADYLIGFNFLVSSYLKKEKIKSIESIESLKYEEKQVVFVSNPPHAVPILREYKKNMLKMVKSGRYEKLITKHKVPKWLLLEKHKLLNHLEALK